MTTIVSMMEAFDNVKMRFKVAGRIHAVMARATF